MKHLILGIALLFTPSAFAYTVANAQLVRVLDGHGNTCTQSYERGTATQFSTLEDIGAEDGDLIFSLRSLFKICGADGWISRNPLDPILSEDADHNPQQTEFRDPELVLSNYAFENLNVINVPDQSDQTTQFRAPLSKVLTDDQLSLVDSGGEALVRVTIFYRSIATLKTIRGEMPLGTRFGGSYTLMFRLRK